MMPSLAARRLSGSETVISGRDIDAFARSVTRPLILTGAPEYDEARRVFNRLIDKRPALIVRCTGVADVIRCVQFAREHDLLVAVRGGAHNAAGFATCDGGLVIDLSFMRAVHVDALNRQARAEGGATWGDVDRQTQAFGLAAVGGVVSTTGIGGLTLGGGQGWFRRTYGMTCDNLVSADIVTAAGEFLSVSEATAPDLLWALKGGGGNFGVVTSFEYRLHPIGPMVAFAGPVYPFEKARTILSRFREFMSDAPDEVNSNVVLWTIPEHAAFPPDVHGREVLSVGGTFAGTVERGADVLQPLREFDNPILDLSSPMPYTALQQLFDPFFRKGELLHYWKALYLDSLNDQVIQEIVRGCSERPSARCIVAVWALGGAMARVGADETPIGSRTAPFLVEIAGSWNEPTDSPRNIAWVRELFDAMHQFSSGKTNLNFSGFDEDNNRFVRAAFGDHYARLARVKHTYDPANVFRLNQNISPVS